MSRPISRLAAGSAGAAGLAALGFAGTIAPDFLSKPDFSQRDALPWVVAPFGTDPSGVPLWEHAAQGAQVILGPALTAGVVVAALATFAGIGRCALPERVDAAIRLSAEAVGALPRLVMVLVLALCVPGDFKGLMPLAITWAVLSAPPAMDEAGATAERLGGAAFVEALRAHGYGLWRIYGVHIVGYNLRPVLVRQAAEVATQVVFLEIALSYLAVSEHEASLTHADSTHSWADILYLGYTALLGAPQLHALALGMFLVATPVFISWSLQHAARAR
jgi:ABC-type dipeptide/oligopeptide/nickel transport system permease subunit